MRYVAVVLLSIAPAYLVWVACGSRQGGGAVIALVMHCFPPSMALWYAARRDPLVGIVAATAAVMMAVEIVRNLPPRPSRDFPRPPNE